MAEGPGHRLSVVIVEDEERARGTLRALLERDPEVRLVGEAAGSGALRLLQSARPDIAFVDVQMPGMDGLEVLRQLDHGAVPIVVFVTAFDQYALEAFDIAAVDYLLKPFSDERFRLALERAKSRARSIDARQAGDALRRVLDAMNAESGSATAGRVLLRDAGRTLLLAPAEIDWVEAQGMYVRVHAGARSTLVRQSMSDLEDLLEAHGFFRIHRSTLVNLTRIVQFRHASHGDYTVLLLDGTKLSLARTRKAALERRLGESIS